MSNVFIRQGLQNTKNPFNELLILLKLKRCMTMPCGKKAIYIGEIEDEISITVKMFCKNCLGNINEYKKDVESYDILYTCLWELEKIKINQYISYLNKFKEIPSLNKFKQRLAEPIHEFEKKVV